MAHLMAKPANVRLKLSNRSENVLLVREMLTGVAETIAGVVGYSGGFSYDPSKPDGTPRKLMDVSRLRALGWKPRVGLEEGLAIAYRDFLTSQRK